jgi:DNA-directed RNA polymerase subunit K
MSEAEAKEQDIPQSEFTKYEKARIIGSRALQISMGAPFLVKLSDDELKKVKYNPLEIAKIEFEQGVIPITVKRPLPAERKR